MSHNSNNAGHLFINQFTASCWVTYPVGDGRCQSTVDQMTKPLLGKRTAGLGIYDKILWPWRPELGFDHISCQNGSALYRDADPLPSQMLWTCNVTCWRFNFQLYFYSTGDFANAKLMYSEFYDPWYCSLTRWRILRIQCNQRSVLSVLIEIHTHTHRSDPLLTPTLMCWQ